MRSMVLSALREGVSELFDAHAEANGDVPPASTPILKIGHAAALVGVSSSRLRLWEQQELIVPSRTESGQRRYSMQDVKRLEKIRRLLDSKAMTVFGLRQQLQVDGQPALSPEEIESSNRNVGARVNALRRRSRMSLRALANEVGVSASTLSALERGVSQPNVGKLTHIAHALGTTTPDLLGVAVASEGQMVVRARERVVLPLATSGIHIENLYRYSKVLQSQMVRVDAGCGSGAPMTHEGEDFLVVLEGQVDITLDLIESYRLSVGDSMTFDSERPHTYENNGAITARFVWVNTPPTF